MIKNPLSVELKMLADAMYDLTDLQENYIKLVDFLKNEINQREYVCTTNHAVLLDNAKKLLEEMGEL